MKDFYPTPQAPPPLNLFLCTRYFSNFKITVINSLTKIEENNFTTELSKVLKQYFHMFQTIAKTLA